MKQHLPILIRTARAVAVVAIAFATLELCTRVQDRVTRGIPALRLQYVAPPLYAYDAAGPHGIPNARDGKFHMNELGFRGPELVAGRATILCLGASETFGIAETEGNEFPRQLERRLASAPGGPYQVVNAALPGERIEDIVRMLPDMLAATRPRFAILYFSPASVIWTEREWNAAHPTVASKNPPPERTPAVRIVGRLSGAMHEALPEPIAAWERRQKATAAIAAAHVVPTAHLPAANFVAFQRRLQQTFQLLDAAHVQTIVVTHATRFGPAGEARDGELDTFRAYYAKLSPDGLFDTDRRLNTILRTAARKRQRTILVDAARRIPPGPENFADFFHFTDRGSALLARMLSEAVSRQR